MSCSDLINTFEIKMKAKKERKYWLYEIIILSLNEFKKKNQK